jgi:hypothetical protein
MPPWCRLIIGLLWVSFLFPVVLCARIGNTPYRPDEPVIVKTWKQGSGQIREQTFEVTLENSNREYEITVDDKSRQRQFRLRFQRTSQNVLQGPSLPCWSAVLKEVVKDKKTGVDTIGFDLMSPEGPGTGDYFPRESWASRFCPVEKPNQVLQGHIYSIKTERVFLVERFIVSLRVTGYRYDDQENVLDSLQLRVDLKNQ